MKSKDTSQPKEGDLSTMNVPMLQYDHTMDNVHFSKSPYRVRNDNFSPTDARGNTVYGKQVRSPQGRNMSNNFSTIGPNMQSMDLNSPMSSMSKNYMMGK